MYKIGIISNPFAKMNKNHPEHNTQMWYTLANDGIYKVTHSLSELDSVCQEFSARKINLVGIVGEDGSIGLVLSYLVKAYGPEKLPKIMLLRGGTINFLALNLGIRSSALKALSDILKRLKRDLPLYEVPVRTLRVNGRIGFLFAGGIVSAFLTDFYKKKTNSWGAALAVGRYLLDWALFGKWDGSFEQLVQPQKLHIQAHPNLLWQDKPLPTEKEEYTIVFASTVPKLPFHVKLFRKIKIPDTHAELVAISEKGRHLVGGALKLFLGADINHYKGVDSTVMSRAEISSDTAVHYSLDGDLMVAEDGLVQIDLGPIFYFCLNDSKII